jgi:uncharacterized protein (TIGR02391 family)
MFGKSHAQKISKARLSLIKLIEKTRTNMTNELKLILDLIGNKRFYEALGYSGIIFELIDALEKQIEMFMTQNILAIYETGAKLSYSLEEIQRKKNEVYKWLSEITQMTKQLQNEISNTIDEMEILRTYEEFIKKVGHDQRFSDFTNTLKVTVIEFEGYCMSELEELPFIYNKMNLHPVIRKASEKLFKDKHYADSILKAYIALINYVKEKSGKKTLDGQNLMGNVFDVKYNSETLEVTDKPVLKLNNLITREEIDEQKGFMYLYLGAVMGIRNPKAHAIIEQKDPFKTLKYLSFASLLAKRVDEAKLD